MAPTTVRDWEEVAETLALERAGRSPDLFPHALGVEPEPLIEWCAQDAHDSLVLAEVIAVQRGRTLVEVLVAMLATHSQIGVELGLWLAQTGRVKL